VISTKETPHEEGSCPAEWWSGILVVEIFNEESAELVI
jgi:hypothetical protein